MINDHISLKKDKPGDKLGSSKTFRISRGMPEHLLLVHINLEKNINLEQKLLFSLSNLRKALKSRSWWSLSKKSPTTKDFCSRELRMAKVKVAGTGVVCLSHLRVIFHYDSISILLKNINWEFSSSAIESTSQEWNMRISSSSLWHDDHMIRGKGEPEADHGKRGHFSK